MENSIGSLNMTGKRRHFYRVCALVLVFVMLFANVALAAEVRDNAGNNDPGILMQTSTATEDSIDDFDVEDEIHQADVQEAGETATPESDFEWNGNVITAYKGLGTDVVIPARAVEIGENAFFDCDINSLSFEEGSKCIKISESAFYGQSLISATLPDTLETIGDSAFSGCDLREIVIPNSVIELCNEAFYNNSNLHKVTILSPQISEKHIVAWAPGGVFQGCNIDELILSDEMEYIPNWLFHYADFAPNMEIKLPAGVKRIGEGAFFEAKNLVKVDLPSGLEKIERIAFGNTGLKEITIPQGTKYIYSGAFRGNADLHKVEILSPSIEYKAIYDDGYGVFEGCNINELNLSDKMKYIPDYLFRNAGFETGMSVTIPDNVTDIRMGAFFGVHNLRSIVLPKGISNIADQAFYDCTAIREVRYRGTEISWQRVVIGKDNEVIKENVTYEGQDPEEPASSGYDPVAVITEDNQLFLVKGQTHDLKDAGYQIISNDGSITLNNRTGVISAKNPSGTAGARLTNGETEIIVHVVSPTITVNDKKTESLANGSTAIVKVNGLNDNASQYKIAWATSNSAVAMVDDNNDCTANVSAVGKGNATISAYIGGKQYSCTVKVKDSVYTASVIQDEGDVLLDPLKATKLKFSNFSAKNASWVCSDARLMKTIKVNRQGKPSLISNGIVRINISTGQFIAVGEGETNLIGTDINGRKVKLHIRVPALPANPVNYVKAGKKVTLKAVGLNNKKARWSIVDGNAYIARLDMGTAQVVSSIPQNIKPECATVTATYNPFYDGEGFIFSFKIYAESPSLNVDGGDGLQMTKLNNYALNMKCDSNFPLKSKYKDIRQSVTWKSSNPAVAYVDENGMIHTHSKTTGVAKLTSKINGVTLSILVTVSE